MPRKGERFSKVTSAGDTGTVTNRLLRAFFLEHRVAKRIAYGLVEELLRTLCDNLAFRDTIEWCPTIR